MRRIAPVLIVLLAITASGIAWGPARSPGPRPTTVTSADLPTWLAGDAWTFETHVVTRDGPNRTSAWNNLTFTVTGRMETVQDGAYLYLYNSSLGGDLSAEGDMTVPQGMVHYTIMSNSVRGYAWTERGDLSVVKTNETFTGTGTATIPLFGTRPLTAAGNLTSVNRPPEEDFDFPVELGDDWRVTSTVNASGEARLVIYTPIQDFVFVQPLSGDTPIDSTSWVNTTESVVVPAGTFESLRIHSVDGGSASTDRWYAPNASNYVKLETHSVPGPTTYSHTWTNLTSFIRVPRSVPVDVQLLPRAVGPGAPFTVLANTSAVNASARLMIPAINVTITGSTDGAGTFRIVVNAPTDNDHTPANTDIGSHGVLVEITAVSGSGFGGATVSLLRPDLVVTGLVAVPSPTADGVATNLTATISVASVVPVYSPVNVTIVTEDVDLDRDGVMDNSIDVYCGRSVCVNTTVAPVLPENPVTTTALWIPRPSTLPQDIRVSAVVDPKNRYEETNESNNLVVTTVRVEGPNIALSNATVEARGTVYAFNDPASLGFVSPLITVAPRTIVNITAAVRNDGVLNISTSTDVGFYNTTVLNGTGDPPFALRSAGPLNAGMDVTLQTVQWAAPAGSGTYFVNITADYGEAMRETSESDNTFVLRLRVSEAASPPDLIPFGASIPAKASVNRPVSIAVRVENVGGTNASGFQVAFYNASAAATPFALVAVGPLGTGAATSWLTATWSSPALGAHVVWIEVDYGDAVPEANETNNTISGMITVYDVPTTTLAIGSPKIVTATTTYLLPVTPLSFSSPDRTGEGQPTIWYHVDTGGWSSIAAGGPFTLPGGPHTISYNATDPLGGVEPTNFATVFVDDVPPETVPMVSNATDGKLVSFSATDGGSGVNWTEYRMDNGLWIHYNGTAVPVTAPGNHTVDFRSTDLLGNREPTRTLILSVTEAPGTAALALNVKPVIATVFAASLLLAGWFAASSLDPPKRRRWLLTFVAPIAIVELITGAISLGVAEMAVPGGFLGLPVDLALLIFGLLAILFARRNALRPT